MVSCNTKPTFANLSMLVILAFILRAATFFFYVQHNERYHQPDSNDYHTGAVTLGVGKGFTKPNGQPVFWRTPGYGWYLSWFYKYYGIKSSAFEKNTDAQKAALWVQILLSSCIPVIIFFLILTLINSLTIAWITAWISVFHLGFVLASTFLLTESLALIFFYLFLIFFYKSFRVIGEEPNGKSWIKNLIIAALFLGITTWIRPMGEFVAIACCILILLFAQDNWKLKLKKISLFFCIFYLTIVPWCIRNYQWSGKWFYTPMMGTYLNVFIAPKVLRDVHNIPLQKTWELQQKAASQQALKSFPAAQQSGKALVLEYEAGKVALPIIIAHPFLAAYEWMKEVFKTAFDIYSSQLVAFANETFKWDPLEEFLFEKIALALYKQPMALWMRLICWLDFIFTLLLWIGIFAGMVVFWLIPLCKKFNVPSSIKAMGGLWLKSMFLIGSIIFMTGGFGYARLRLPVEPLMIMLSLTFWLRNSHILNKKERV